MDENRIVHLEQTNQRIINAILKKAEHVCPGSIALIGIYGSFCTGDIHEYSDLDLCIVINDDNGWKIGHCFILDGIGYDIYCTPWSRLEELATFPHAHVTNLLNLQLVYQADDDALARYMNLRRTLKDTMRSPFNATDADKVNRHLREAKQAYADLMLCDSNDEGQYVKSRLLLAVEDLMFAANKRNIERGVRRIPEELNALSLKPDHMWSSYHALITADALPLMQELARTLLKSCTGLVSELTATTIAKSPLTAQGLTGAYEEVFSNWRNKMVLAKDTDDVYLALMTLRSCQAFYDEFASEVDVERINIFGGFDSLNLAEALLQFDQGLEQLRNLYAHVGLQPVVYATVSEFENAYLFDI